MTTLASPATVRTALERLKCVFLEDPGVRLDVADACLLAGIDSGTCRIFLRWLEQDKFVRRTAGGLYTRCSSENPAEPD